MVRLGLPDKLANEATCCAYVTDLGQAVLEARARWTVAPDRRDAVIGSKYSWFGQISTEFEKCCKLSA